MQLLFAALLLPCANTAADFDWPQWRGPDRNDISKETGLLKKWPDGGPQLLWTYKDGGNGYSGPAVVGDRLYSMGAREGTEYLFALDVSTGNQAWECKIGTRFKNPPWGDGPRGTPTIDGDRIYGIGGQGDLICAELATGKKVWQKSLKSDLGGRQMSGWGYSESPLVDGNQVVCTPGGTAGTLAALDKKTGKLVWRSKGTTDPAGYSSIIVADLPGKRHYVQLTGTGIIGIDPKSGARLWRVDKSDSYRTAVIPTAIYYDGYVFATSGYGAGCDLIKLSDGGSVVKAEVVYSNKNMVNHHGGVVLIGEHVYGYSDRGGWVCQDLKKGDVVWSAKKLGKGAVTFADGHLYCYSENDGTMVLVGASPEGWKESGRFTIPQESTIRSPNGRIWTHPVVANGRLYLRDQDLLYCFDVKDRAASAR